MITEIKKDNKIYVHDTSNDGYYGLRVLPGSSDDNTQGKVGIHWIYLQYEEKEIELVKKLRSLIPEFNKVEDEEKEIENEKEQKIEKKIIYKDLCPKCHTWCYGDCQS